MPREDQHAALHPPPLLVRLRPLRARHLLASQEAQGLSEVASSCRVSPANRDLSKLALKSVYTFC